MKPDFKQLAEEMDLVLRNKEGPETVKDMFNILVKFFWLLGQADHNEVETSLYHLKAILYEHSDVYNKYFSILLSYEILHCGDHHTIVQKIVGNVGEFLSHHGDLETCLSVLCWPDECFNDVLVGNGSQSLCKGIIDVICRSNLNLKKIDELKSIISKIINFLKKLFEKDDSLELFCVREAFISLFTNASLKYENKKSQPMFCFLVGGILQTFNIHLIQDVIYSLVQDLNLILNIIHENVENEILVYAGLCIFNWMNLPHSTNITNIVLSYCGALVLNKKLIPLMKILIKGLNKLCLLIKLPITRKAALELYVNLQLSFTSNPMFFHKHSKEVACLITYLEHDGHDLGASQMLLLMVHCLLKLHPQSRANIGPLLQVVESYDHLPNEQLENMLAANKSIFDMGYLGLFVHNSTYTRGLLNLGNTCYINCIIQCLFSCTSFCREILQTSLYSGLFSKSLQLTFANLLLSKRPTYTPNDIVSCSEKFFSFGHQHDCSEFLTHYLETMSDEFSEDGESVVSRNFNGCMRNSVRCLECGAQSIKTECFSSLPISIPVVELELDQRTMHSLSELVNDHFKKEILDNDNMYACDFCKKMARAERRYSVVSGPRYLVIVLLRFLFDNQSCCRKKVSPLINCSKIIELQQEDIHSEHKTKTIIYELKALTIHSGATLEAGHYYSLVSFPDGASGVLPWFLVDDTQVKSISTQEFVKLTSEAPLQTPYVLFFARQDREQSLPLTEVDVIPCLKDIVEKDNKIYERELRSRRLSNSNKMFNGRPFNSKDDDDDNDEYPTRGSFCDGPRLIF